MEKEKFRFKPLHDRVLVLPDEGEKVSKGGIHVPVQAQKSLPQGTIVAVGSGLDKPLEVKPGDRVIYHSFTGADIPLKKSDMTMADASTSPDDIITFKAMREAEIIMYTRDE